MKNKVIKLFGRLLLAVISCSVLMAAIASQAVSNEYDVVLAFIFGAFMMYVLGLFSKFTSFFLSKSI